MPYADDRRPRGHGQGDRHLSAVCVGFFMWDFLMGLEMMWDFGMSGKKSGIFAAPSVFLLAPAARIVCFLLNSVVKR